MADANLQDLLSQFIAQAKTINLKTLHYPKSYRRLKVTVSFGKGTPANIPWISFLSGTNKPACGIYPVYLLFKKYDLLLLAYGVSERWDAKSNWELPPDTKSVGQYFSEKGILTEKYGSSFVHKSYDLNKELHWKQMEGDLNEVIEKYKLVKDS